MNENDSMTDRQSPNDKRWNHTGIRISCVCVHALLHNHCGALEMRAHTCNNMPQCRAVVQLSLGALRTDRCERSRVPRAATVLTSCLGCWGEGCTTSWRAFHLTCIFRVVFAIKCIQKSSAKYVRGVFVPRLVGIVLIGST